MNKKCLNPKKQAGEFCHMPKVSIPKVLKNRLAPTAAVL
jgi:hypothetical protein